MNAETVGNSPNSPNYSPNEPQKRSGFSGKQVLLFLFLAILVTVGITYWIIRSYVYASDFKPVELSQKEQSQLDDKLRSVGVNPTELLPEANRPSRALEDAVELDADGNLKPEKYSEEGASRVIDFSERELNSMLAKNSDVARRFAVDLSENLASAKFLVPFDNDFPILGGKTLRFNAGLEVDYRDGQPVVILRGASIMGVPIPNSWLGGLKNVDLVSEFGTSTGFWQSFAEGVELIEINDGKVHIELKE